MKKFLKAGKKTLSVIMAIMMVLTAWVWVAPTEASAATAGTYDVKVRIQTTDSVDVGDDKNLELTLNFKKDNGTGDADKKTNSVSYTWAENDNADNTWTINGLNGYPTSFSVTCIYAWTLAVTRKWGVTIYISVYDNDTSTWTEVAKQSFSEAGSGSGQTTKTYTISSIGGTPTATTVKFLSGDNSLTIPKTGETNVTKTYTAGVYDQYGVRMTYEPTYYVRSTAPTSAQTSSSTISGVSMSSGTSSGTMTVTSSAQNTSADSKNVYVHAKYGSVYANKTVALNDPSYTFKYYKNTTDSATISPSSDTSKAYYNTFGDTAISGTRTGFTFKGFYQSAFNDSYENEEFSGTALSSSTRYTADTDWYAAWQANKHTLTFNYKDENYENKVHVSEEYYGRTYEIPDYPETIEIKDGDITNYKYEFNGWKVGNSIVTLPSTMPDEDITYLADYTETVYYADLTALEEAIADAKAKQATALYNENAYTETSVSVFEDTLTLAEATVNRAPLLSEQTSVDGLADTLNNANNNLDIKNYTVLFVDEDGTILKDGYFFVPHGASVTVPQNPEKAYDEINHYAFDFWDYEESDGLDECNYVTDNLIYVASFLATPHIFTETKTPSTCTADGVITYTCDCGYSYTAADPDDLASHKWSTDYKELVPATCATAGSEAKYCTACDAVDESSKREIEKLGHNFGEYTEYTPATCFGKGAEIAICSRCEAKDVKEIPQKSHIYGAAETVEKTCTADGYTKEVCTICGFTNIRDIDVAKGHTLKVESVPETCVSVGYTKTYCEKCDFERTTTYPATGVHSYPDTWETVAEASCVGNGVEKRVCTVCNSATETRLTALAEHISPAEWTVEVPATCDGDGRQVKNCTVCGKELEAETIAKLGHNYEAYAEGTYDATCTTAGATAVKCSLCGDINITVLQPTGHKYENEGAIVETAATCTSSAYKTYNCDNCDYSYVEHIIGSTVLPHDFTGTETVISAATCTADGKKTVQCKNCDATTEVILPKLGHAYGNWQVVKEATNSEDGQWMRVCANNAEHVEYITIPKGGHAWDSGTVTEAASCEATGTMVYKCTAHTDCGVTLEVTIPVTQHTVAQREIEATCTEKGKVEAYCTVCNDVLSTEEIPVKAHNYVASEAVAPSCTTSGYTPYTCSCGKTYDVYDASKPATGHSLVEGASTANCTEAGKMTLTCSVCSNYTTTVDVPALGHNYVEDASAATEATCAAPATKTYKCSRCAASYTISVGDKTSEHTWGKETVVEAATATSLGYKTVECSVCGQIKAETIPATGDHEFTVETADKKDPTCTQDGYIVYACATNHSCGLTSKVTVPATGHKEDLDYKAATCGEAGYARMVCTVDGCNEVLSEEVIPALGHLYGEGTVTNATCTAEGKIEYSCTRTGCGATHEAVIATNSNAHRYKTVVTPATCYKEGSVVTKCVLCDDEITNEDLPMIEHTWNDGEIKQGDAATCTADGKKTYTCTVENCGATKTETISKLGHSWGEWSITKAPTATDEGEQTRTCIRGGCKETVAIPALGESATYTVKFVVNGEVIYTQTVNYLGSAAAPAIADKAPDSKYHYSFGWDRDFSRVTGDLTVNGVYTPVSHTYGEWVVDKTADCRNEGLRHRECDCGYVQQETVAKLAHDFSEVLEEKAATCTDNGYKVVVCKNCGDTETQTVKKLGHSMTYYQGYAATCDTDGVASHYSCSRCGKDFEDRAGNKQLTTTVITKKYHTYIVVEGSAATCTNDGVTDYRYCTSCGYTQQPQTIPATGHADVNNDNSCDKCGATYMQGGEIVCSCSCHKTGFFNELIYKILSFFWRLFGSNKSCECGRVHY